jgi:CDP-glucose 4,6-dehydratase
MIDPSFWKNRRILLTGHTGFKGGWLALWLNGMGARVTGYALPPATGPTLFAGARIGSCVHSVFGDVRDLDRLCTLVREERPEIIIHMAAQALVRRSLRQPVETFSTNVMGTVNVLAASSHCPSTRVVLIVTSDKCYESSSDSRGHREDDPLGGRDPYSASKACAELVAGAYRSSFSSNADMALIATARAGNVIGGGDWAEDRLVPDLIRAFQRGEAARIRYPDAIRAWQHVLDPLCGYLLLIENLHRTGEAFSGAWNFAPSQAQACSVRVVADALSRAWGNGARWVTDTDSHPPESTALRLDCTKAITQLGWRVRIPVQHAVESVADWFRHWSSGSDMRLVSERQIERFCYETQA